MKIEFPQPEVKAPKHGQIWFYVDSQNDVCENRWYDSSTFLSHLAAGTVYLTREAAEQRAQYTAQEMKRLVMPQWFRDLGPEFLIDTGPSSRQVWRKSNPAEWVGVFHDLNPACFKPMPKRVTHTLNGREYSWPEKLSVSKHSSKNTVTGWFVNCFWVYFGNACEVHAEKSDAITELEYLQAVEIQRLRDEVKS